MYLFSFFFSFAKSFGKKESPRYSYSDISACQENRLLSSCAGATRALCLAEPRALDPGATAQGLDALFWRTDLIDRALNSVEAAFIPRWLLCCHVSGGNRKII